MAVPRNSVRCDVITATVYNTVQKPEVTIIRIVFEATCICNRSYSSSNRKKRGLDKEKKRKKKNNRERQRENKREVPRTTLGGCGRSSAPLARQMKGPAVCRSTSWPRALVTSKIRYRPAGPAGLTRCFGTSASLCRRPRPTDARIEGLGKEIADEYASLKTRYGMSRSPSWSPNA